MNSKKDAIRQFNEPETRPDYKCFRIEDGLFVPSEAMRRAQTREYGFPESCTPAEAIELLRRELQDEPRLQTESYEQYASTVLFCMSATRTLMHDIAVAAYGAEAAGPAPTRDSLEAELAAEALASGRPILRTRVKDGSATLAEAKKREGEFPGVLDAFAEFILEEEEFEFTVDAGKFVARRPLAAVLAEGYKGPVIDTPELAIVRLSELVDDFKVPELETMWPVAVIAVHTQQMRIHDITKAAYGASMAGAPPTPNDAVEKVKQLAAARDFRAGAHAATAVASKADSVTSARRMRMN